MFVYACADLSMCAHARTCAHTHIHILAHSQRRSVCYCKPQKGCHTPCCWPNELLAVRVNGSGSNFKEILARCPEKVLRTGMCYPSSPSNIWMAFSCELKPFPLAKPIQWLKGGNWSSMFLSTWIQPVPGLTSFPAIGEQTVTHPVRTLTLDPCRGF